MHRSQLPGLRGHLEFVVERGIAEASRSTLVLWLREDAIRPWLHRSWIFPTDPDFAAKAGPILDIYKGRWEGRLLRPGDFVICGDEKPTIQARARIAPTLALAAGVPRGGSSTPTVAAGRSPYMAAWDVRRGKVFDRSEQRAGSSLSTGSSGR